MIRFNLIPVPGQHEKIVAELRDAEHAFDLDRNGIGTAIMAHAVDGIMWNMIQELDPDGLPWDDLSPSYEAWKKTVAPGKPIGVLHGLMRTMDQLAGVQLVTTNFASMTYGTDPVARVEATKFQEGGIVTGTAQPPRPFYGLTREALDDIDAEFDARFTTAFP